MAEINMDFRTNTILNGINGNQKPTECVPTDESVTGWWVNNKPLAAMPIIPVDSEGSENKNYDEEADTISIGAGATVALVDHKKLGARAIKYMMFKTGSGSTYRVLIKKHNSASDSSYVVETIFDNQTGSAGYQELQQTFEAGYYTTEITDQGGGGFSCQYLIKERV